MAKSEYDKIAEEYYDVKHITSRNFDSTTHSALKEEPFILSDMEQGLILEIGAGRGRANEFLGIDSSRVIQLDKSKLMFEIPNREPCLLQVLADACNIPFISHQFITIVGFLVDPFLGLESLAEAYRMLRQDGRILLTTPTAEWGLALRKHLGIDLMTTRFKKIGTENVITLPSLLHSKEQLFKMMSHIGFKNINIYDHCLPIGENLVSPDIEIVAKEKGKNVYDIPIIHTIRAIK